MFPRRPNHLLSHCERVTCLLFAAALPGLHGFAQTWNLQAPSAACSGLSHVEIVNTTNNGGNPVGVYGGLAAGLAYDPATGTVYFAENFTASGLPVVGVLSPNGSVTTLSPASGFGEVTAVAFYQGNLYVADGVGASNPTGATPNNAIWQWNQAS